MQTNVCALQFVSGDFSLSGVSARVSDPLIRTAAYTHPPHPRATGALGLSRKRAADHLEIV